MGKTKIVHWKIWIIKWALKELKPYLPALDNASFDTLDKFGIADLHYNESTQEYAVYID